VRITARLALVVSLLLPLAASAQSVSPNTPPDTSEGEESAPPPDEEAPPSTWKGACRMDESAWSGSRVPDTPVYARAPDGACFCSVLTARATRADRRHTFGAWTLGTIAASLIVVGPVLGNDDDGKKLWQRERGTLLSVAGIALAPLAYYFFMRGDRDGTVAARATEAQGQGEADDDFALYRACSAAKADWVASREASLAFSAIAVERIEKAAEQTRGHAAEAAANAEETRESAEVANKAAEQAQQSAEEAEASAPRGKRGPASNGAEPDAENEEPSDDKTPRKPVRP
jgi:hypothetical protein